MTWEQFLEKLRERGWTQQEFAIQINTDPATVSRWRNRKNGIPKWVPWWFERNPARVKTHRAR